MRTKAVASLVVTRGFRPAVNVEIFNVDIATVGGEFGIQSSSICIHFN
jgi:hypothetical protein